MFGWYDEERVKDVFFVEWFYDSEKESIEDVEVIRAYNRNDAEERFWDLMSKKGEEYEDAIIVAITQG